MNTCIFDIKRYALNDGPGIRTTIFLKGCPLRCVWCHNPESWRSEPEVLFKSSRCIGCNSCGLYPDHLPPETSEAALSAAGRCPSCALEVCGRRLTLTEVLAEVEKERDVMTDSGGGVTLCGGEPLMHAADTLALLDALGHCGFHRTVDTSLYAPASVVKRAAERAELFLVDLKHMDSTRHRQLTGVPNEPILANVALLPMEKVRFRLPLIAGLNADEANLLQTARFIAGLPPALQHQPPILHLLPYHDTGKDKHRRRGTTYNPLSLPMATPTAEQLRLAADIFATHGIRTIEGG